MIRMDLDICTSRVFCECLQIHPSSTPSALPRGCRRERDVAVTVVGRCDINDLDLGVCDNFAPIGRGVLPSEARGGLPHRSGVTSADLRPHGCRQIKEARRLGHASERSLPMKP